MVSPIANRSEFAGIASLSSCRRQGHRLRLVRILIISVSLGRYTLYAHNWYVAARMQEQELNLGGLAFSSLDRNV